jgi:hypothetical protein
VISMRSSFLHSDGAQIASPPPGVPSIADCTCVIAIDNQSELSQEAKIITIN